MAPRLFINTLPHLLQTELQQASRLSVTPIGIGGVGFDTIIGLGTVKWVVDGTGALLVVPKIVDGGEVPHSVMTNGQPVQAAGEADIAGAKGLYFGLEINNHSGHYLPSPESIEVALGLFRENGITFYRIVRVGGSV